jgi:hypothetical protein
MATRDITRNMRNEIALNIQDITTDTTTAGNIFNMKDFDGGVNVTLISGAVAGGTYDILVEHGDESDLSDAVAVADTELLGQDSKSTVAPELQAQITGANQIKKIGIVSAKAFARISIESTGVSGSNILGAIVEKKPEILPAEIVA